MATETAPFFFRRKHVGGGQLPVIIQGPIGTRQGPFTDKDEEVYVRASSVKDYIADKGGLATYDSNGRMWATATNENLRLQVAAIEDWQSAEGKLRLKDLRVRADQISGATDKREGGTAYHGLFARLDRAQPLPATIPDEHRFAIDAYRRVMRLFTVHEIELAVVCDELGAGGNLDKILSPRGVMIPVDRKGNQFAPEVTPDQRVVGDVKAAKDPKYFGEFTLQFTPYAHGCGYREEIDPEILAQQEEEFGDSGELWSREARLARVKAVHRTPLNVRTDVALLIHVPFKGAHAELFWFDTARGVAMVEHAMGTRRIRSELRSTFAPAELPVVEGIDVEAPPCPNCTASDCVGCEPPPSTAAAALAAWGEPAGRFGEDPGCPRCQADTHTCHGCGTPLPHGIEACDPCSAVVATLPTSPAPVLSPVHGQALQPGPDGTFAGGVFAHAKAYGDAQRLLEEIRRIGEDTASTEDTLLELYRTNGRIWRAEHTTAAGEASAKIAARVGQAVAS